MKVEIQNADGSPIPGFNLEDSTVLYGDSTKQVMSWKNGSDVSSLAGKPVRLKFELKDGDLFEFGDTSFKAIETKGHTQGHLCLSFEKDKILFSGDMVFGMGCGRPFEGNAEDLFNSFKKLSHLSNETIIYCGHEYTQTNGNFSLSIAPDDEAIKNRMIDVDALRANDKPTIPTKMKLERETNLFMRAKSVEDFQTLRDKRNKF